jgi:hypothetical protein
MGQGRMKVPCVNGDAGKIPSAKYETVLKWRTFFLFGPHLFLRYERSVRKKIKYTVISIKVLFAPHRFLSNKSPIHFAGASGNGNTFFNGKWHVQNENGHQSPRSQTYAQQL